ACRSTTAASSRAPSRPPAPSWASPSTPSHHARLRPTPRSRGYTGPSATSTTPSSPPTLTIEEQRAALKAYLHHYNHHRPHKALDYQTPAAYAHQRSLPSQMT